MMKQLKAPAGAAEVWIVVFCFAPSGAWSAMGHPTHSFTVGYCLARLRR